MHGSDASGGDIRRHNNVGVLRLLLAALVVVSHSPELIDGNRSRELLTRLFGTLSFGDAAVDGFFLISGYLITKSFRDSRSVGDYLGKRLLRIYPGFVVASLATILVVAPLAGGHLAEVSPLQALKKLCLLQGPGVPGAFEGLPRPDLNGSMWTVAYEVRCYLLVILFGRLADRTNRRGYAALLIGLFALYAVRDRLPNIPNGVGLFGRSSETIRLTAVFFVGGAFYVWRDRIAYGPRGALAAAAALAGLLFVAPLAEPALAVLGGYLIFWSAFACPAGRLSRWTDHTDPSYGLYLYAWPVQNLLVLHRPGIAPWTVTAVTLAVAFALGLLSWHGVEKPALHRKAVFARPRGGPAAGRERAS